MQNKDSNYIIYKICCNDLKLSKYFYIGYTQNFRQCTYWHKKNCININNKTRNNKLYNIIRAYGGWDNWRMAIIKEYKNISHIEAQIKTENCRMNIHEELFIENLINENENENII